MGQNWPFGTMYSSIFLSQGKIITTCLKSWWHLINRPLSVQFWISFPCNFSEWFKQKNISYQLGCLLIHLNIIIQHRYQTSKKFKLPLHIVKQCLDNWPLSVKFCINFEFPSLVVFQNDLKGKFSSGTEF